MTHDAINAASYNGNSVLYPCRTQAEADNLRKMARNVTQLMKSQNRPGVVTVDVIGVQAIVKVTV